MRAQLNNLLRSFFRNTPLHICLLTGLIACTQWYNRGIFGDPDAQYHLTVAKLMPLWPSSTQFFWLPFTSWGSAYADQHYLFHLFLKPLALINAGQAIIVLGFLIHIIGFNWLLKQITTTNRVPWLWLYTLGSADLFTRISLIKAEATGMVFLYILTGLLLKRKWPWLLPLMILYTLWYGGSTIFLGVVAVYCAIEFFRTKTILLKPIYWTLGGFLIGLLIHPYNTTLPALLFDQITRAGLLRDIPGGNEWYAQPAAFIPDNILIFLPWVLSLWYLLKHKRQATPTLWFIALCGITLFLLGLYSNRIILYWVPYAVVLTALMLSQPIQQAWKQVWTDSDQNIRKILCAVLLVFICLRGLENVINITTTIHRIGIPSNRLRNAATWLSTHTAAGAVVTNTSWHIFPELFFWNTRNSYIAGEDPAFLWLADPARYAAWKQLDRPLPTTKLIPIMTAFNSQWLITPRHNYPVSDSPHLTEVYADQTVRIFHLTR